MKVRPIQGADVPDVAGALARSFERDPFCLWMLPNDTVPRLERFFARLVRDVYSRRGRLAFTTDGSSGASLWSPPGRYKYGMLEQLRLTPVLFNVIGLANARSAAAGGATIDEHHPDEPHWYLSILGVHPDHQRQGLGGALIDAGIEHAARDSLPVYLDTSNPDNVPYYRHHGFEVVCEYDIPHNGPHMWGMLRRR